MTESTILETELVKFEWHVDLAGYRVAKNDEASAIGSTILSAPTEEIIRNNGAIHTYCPASSQLPIHRRLAELPDDEGGALDFVNEFGLLYDGDRNFYLSQFLYFKRSVKTLLDRLEGVHQFDKSMKRRHNELSDEMDLPAFSSLSAQLFNDGPVARLSMKIDPNTMTTHFWPVALADWILICVANELVNGPKWRYCAAPGCRKLMKLGHGGYKANAITCSDACRQAKRRASEN